MKKRIYTYRLCPNSRDLPVLRHYVWRSWHVGSWKCWLIASRLDDSSGIGRSSHRVIADKMSKKWSLVPTSHAASDLMICCSFQILMVTARICHLGQSKAFISGVPGRLNRWAILAKIIWANLRTHSAFTMAAAKRQFGGVALLNLQYTLLFTLRFS
ncbi:hypothetical protein IPG36_06605 [bacterium]|nr:MAG: hypothetical protein IPG36_06605 [bacterium]